MDDTMLFYSKVLIAVALLTAVITPEANAVAAGDQVTVSAPSGLRLRRGAGTRTQKLAVLKDGSAAVATGRTRTGWIEVQAGQRVGWVKDDYVTEARFCADCQDEPSPSTETNPLLRAGRAIAKSIQDTGDAVFNGVLSYARRLASFFYVGRQSRANLCWRAVWNTLRAADLVSGEMTQDSAKNALKDLRKFGFRHDARACKTPGALRVYGGNRGARRFPTKGDVHGHIEMVGPDGSYNHFLKSKDPINERLGEQRRPLLYCLIK